MHNNFLGHVIKEDRKRLKITQHALQEKVKHLAIENDKSLSLKAKEALRSHPGNYVEMGGNHFYANIPGKLVSNIERGVARTVSKHDLNLIATILNEDVEKYLSLEINPLNLINQKIETSTYQTQPSFERSITFEPEFRQAGVSILSFFSELVENEFGGQSVKVGIMQNGNVVTLRVETPEGELLKEVEKALNQYGLAVMGKSPIETVSNNPQLVQDLKTRLEVTSLELRLRKDSSLEQSKQYEQRISNLEHQINSFHDLVGKNLIQQSKLAETIQSLSSSSQPSETFMAALSVIDTLSEQNKSTKAEKQLKESLNV